MSDGPANAWQCPSCGRHIPRYVEVCRCGSERRRLEELGYKFDTAPGPPAGSAFITRSSRVDRPGLAAALIGYRSDAGLSTGSRVVLQGLFVIAVTLVCGALVRVTHTDPLPTRENIQVLTTLEDYTRGAGPAAKNTIPAFLASAGVVAVLAPSGTPTDLVGDVNETDLQQGYCSQNVARQIRHEFPGSYDDWPDAKLESTVLKKYPEYAGRLCVLSVRLPTPGEIVKYELKPRSLLSQSGLWLRTLFLTLVFTMACLNLYYRAIVGRRETES